MPSSVTVLTVLGSRLVAALSTAGQYLPTSHNGHATSLIKGSIMLIGSTGIPLVHAGGVYPRASRSARRLRTPRRIMGRAGSVRPETINKRIRDIRQLLDQAC